MPKDAVSKRLNDAIARRRAPASKIIEGLVESVAPFMDHLNGPVRLPLALQRAFADFGLDPQKPSDWPVLTFGLAGVLYGRGKAGRPKKLIGHGRSYYQKRAKLIEDIAAIKRSRPKVTDEVMACELGMSLGTFRRRRREAKQTRHQVLKVSTPN